MAPTYDKYEPIAGGFRAKLGVALPLVAGGFFGLVSLNASGRVIPGAGGNSGPIGVLVKNVARGPVGSWDTSLHAGIPNPHAPIGAQALDQVDVMTSGEIANLDKEDFPAGTKVFGAADGTISTTGGAGTYPIGHTVEAGRLVVRVAQNLTAASA